MRECEIVLLQVKPEEIDETILLENELPKEAEEEKQGILDVHVCLTDGVQIDIEMQVFYEYYSAAEPPVRCGEVLPQLSVFNLGNLISL